MGKIAEIQKKVFDFLIAYRNDDEKLSLPYIKIYSNELTVSHFLYKKMGERIKKIFEVVYTLNGKIYINKSEDNYQIVNDVNVMMKKSSILKVYEFFDKLLMRDFNLNELDKLDKDIYFLASGDTLNVYLNTAEYFINNFLR